MSCSTRAKELVSQYTLIYTFLDVKSSCFSILPQHFNQTDLTWALPGFLETVGLLIGNDASRLALVGISAGIASVVMTISKIASAAFPFSVYRKAAYTRIIRLS